jgi:UDP-N-acetylmuramoyl-L-alanyl-D-glutamate--2,6-diaminopimelate ligase
LHTLRPHVSGRLVVLFGCGGDRDSGKRIEMGRAAQENADYVILSDDNPRGEDPTLIRSQALKGCPDAMEIGDRAEAIRHGVASLGAGDILVVAGKGHEQGQIIGDEIRPFDDASVVRAAVAEVFS